MAPSNKKIRLRAFKIDNPCLTEVDSGILSLLKRVLTDTSTAQQRRMKLNEDDLDEDLLSNFIWPQNNSFLFGMMLRIIPAAQGGVISDNLFNQPKITFAEINAGEPNQSQYKGHYYFAINNNYIVTNLSGAYSIDRLQTYINWLLRDVRDARLYEFSPVMKLPEGIPLSNIKGIEFSGGHSAVTAGITENEEGSHNLLQNLTESVLDQIFSDTPSMNDISRSQVITAKLVLTVRNKPKDMSRDEYQRVMGSVTRQITNDNGIAILTKDGGRYSGERIKETKDVSIETTTANRIVEEQLRQRMESYLNELNNLGNG